MAAKRKDDPRCRPVYRSERIVEEAGQWYFYTREGTLEGPFEDRQDAELQVEAYIRVMNSGLLPEQQDTAVSPSGLKRIA